MGISLWEWSGVESGASTAATSVVLVRGRQDVARARRRRRPASSRPATLSRNLVASSSSDSGRAGPPRLVEDLLDQRPRRSWCAASRRPGTGSGKISSQRSSGTTSTRAISGAAVRVAGQLVGEVVEPDAEPAAAEQPGDHGVRAAELRLVAGLRVPAWPRSAGRWCGSPRSGRRSRSTATSSGRTPRSRSARPASIGGVGEVVGRVGLEEDARHRPRRSPRPSVTASGSNWPRSKASKKPNRPSSTVGGPVKPRRTSWAAVTPAWAAQPQCSRLTVPPVRLASMIPGGHRRGDAERVDDALLVGAVAAAPRRRRSPSRRRSRWRAGRARRRPSCRARAS